MAVRTLHTDTVRALLSRDDIDVNVLNNKGKTPLHYAIILLKHSKEIVLALLSRQDMHVNIKDNEGKTPLAVFTELDCD